MVNMSDTGKCRTCYNEITQDPEFDLLYHNIKYEIPLEHNTTITENPAACFKCKKEVDDVHQLCTQLQPHNISPLIKEEIKQEVTEDGIKCKEIVKDECVLFNTDISLSIEESISVGIFYCHHCNYGTNDKQNLTDHIFGHRFKCSYCNYTTPEDYSSMNHQQIHLPIGNLQCKICNYTCIESRLFDDHMATHNHAGLNASERSFQQPPQIHEYSCHDCGYKTNSKIILEFHAKVHLKYGQFLCEVCTFGAQSEDGLKSHILTHDNVSGTNRTHFKHFSKNNNRICSTSNPLSEKFFSCNKCNYNTNFKSNLKVHMLRHVGGQGLGCDKCGYKTNFKCNLKVHMIKHSGGERFSCDKCDFKTQLKSSLANHKRIHSKEKLFKCSLCEFCSKYPASLKNHSMIHTGKRPFNCDKCEYNTYSKSSLVRHKTIHSNEKPFKCNSCVFSSKRSHSLKIHMMIHSGERPFNCDECDYNTYSKPRLVRHKRIHSKEETFK